MALERKGAEKHEAPVGSALHVTTPFSKNHFLSTSCANFSVTTKIKARH
jgi:hypothetical protein